MKKTIIFDFDGTIADTLGPIMAVFNKNSKSFRYKHLSPETIEKLRGQNSEEILRQLRVPWQNMPFVIRRVRQDLREHIDSVELITGIKSVIEELHKDGKKLIIVTSNSKEIVDKFLKRREICVFDKIYSTGFLSKQRTLRRVLSEQKISANSTVYIGDETRDIVAAKAAKIDVIAVTWGFNNRAILEANKPDLLADKPAELLNLIEKLSTTAS